MDGADAKAPTTLGAMAAFIKPDRKLLDAERTAVAVPFGVKFEHELHDLRFDGVDDELLFNPRAALFDLLRRIAKREREPL